MQKSQGQGEHNSMVENEREIYRDEEGWTETKK